MSSLLSSVTPQNYEYHKSYNNRFLWYLTNIPDLPQALHDDLESDNGCFLPDICKFQVFLEKLIVTKLVKIFRNFIENKFVFAKSRPA
jgi:hypothetical protein